MKDYILVLDAGTTSIKSQIFNRDLELVSMETRRVQSLYPGPRMVEQDPEEIFRLVVESAAEAMEKIGLKAEDIACAAITNQRTSWLFWDMVTQKPLYNLVTWQDSRGVDYLQPCFIENEQFNQIFPGVAPALPPIFLAVAVESTKQISPDFADALKGKNVRWGNVDTWLLFKLTNGREFATSASTASNSTVLDNPSGQWATPLAQFVGMRDEMFPEVLEENADYGVIDKDIFGAEIPIYCMIADQQASMFAQGCFDPTVAKCTNGSGTFVNVNIGEEYKTYGSFFTSIAWKLGGKITFMFEGNSFTAGSCLEWAQHQLGLFDSINELNRDAASVQDSNGVFFVPALGGMSSAPYNDPTARASFMGLNPGANRKHLERAVLDAMGYAASDLIISFQEMGVDIRKLSVSGGVSNSDTVIQLMSNVLGMDVGRPESIEATGYGAAILASTRLGWRNLEDCISGMPAAKVFQPDENKDRDANNFQMWKKALDRSLKWLE